jgi:hypothetical protein
VSFLWERTAEHVNRSSGTIHCIGCQALVPDFDGPTHAYIGASPGCWRVYGEVLAREYGEYAYPDCHRLTVDAYAAQHPGVPSRRSIQSVAVHLIWLHLVIERGLTSSAATRLMKPAVQRAHEFAWLDPPSFAGGVTILDVAAAEGLEAHEAMVGRWAESVWSAWRAHHGTVRRWADITPAH